MTLCQKDNLNTKFKLYEWIMKKFIFLIMLIPTISFASSMKMIGEKGNLNDVSKVIEVKMYDNYYEPSQFNIKKKSNN